jgi:putative peptidoglycan lipid II flippase
MMGSVLLSRLLGVVREQVLAYAGGAGSEMDAYVAAFLIPDILNHLLAGGFMSITFIPIFQRHLVEGREDKAWAAFSNILTIGTLALIALVSVCLLFTRELLGLMGERISNPAQLDLATHMTRIILPAQIFFYWGALLMAVQLGRKRFLVPALAPLIYNAGIIAGGLLLGPWLGIEGFAWGVLGGAFLGNYVVQVIGAARTGLEYHPRCNIRDADLKKYVFMTVPLIIGVGMQFSSEALFKIFGSYLRQGSIACLNYATKALWALNGLFGQALGQASFPFLSQLAAEGKLEEMNRVAHRVIGRVAVLTIPTAAVMGVLAWQVIAVLFQHGKFSAASTTITGSLLALLLFGSFAFAANTIVVRCYYALQNTWLPMVVSTIVVALTIPLYWVLARTMDTPGVALAGAITMNVQLVVTYTIWIRRDRNRAELPGLLLLLVKVCGAGGVAMAGCWGLRLLFEDWALETMGTLMGNLFVALAAGIPALAVAYVLTDLFGVTHLRPRVVAAAAAVMRRAGMQSRTPAM